MSVIAPSQGKLSPQLWDKNQKLLPHITTQILNTAYKFGKKYNLNIKRILLVGSHTGYKWSSTSDLDVNLIVDKGTLPESWQKTRLTSNTINNQLARGTKFPISYFLTEWDFSKDLDQSYKQHAEYGVWDVQNSQWIVPPNPKELEPLTESEKQDVKWASMLEKKFKALWEKYKNAPNDLKFIYWIDLKILADQIEKNRKLNFTTGWGDSRYNENNLIFKYLEDASQYNKLFKKLIYENYLERKNKLQNLEKISSLKLLRSGIDSRLFALKHSKSPRLAKKTQDQLDKLKEYYYNKSIKSNSLDPKLFLQTRQKGDEAMFGLRQLRQIMNGDLTYPEIIQPITKKFQI